ncbi:hypothetical protein FPR_23540 [Faecalibacterium prausnitzii SL3/3]|jgi:hypothetical protein|uniref:Uncharacterized protein n=1 Tax=Faecalibacterium prausnitzii SL3/3 TaxID=657322 RepID=D4KCG0_9FIRM|nr:hypothetical protein [Faecalibacterium prausnitzii]CBL02523.1 hypothetical protein FPR_23540 [Faecalibacterium prausnitzii SL3/3]
MLTEIAWLMTKAYIILIFAAAVIRSEQILYDTSTYIFRGDKMNVMYGCVALNVFIIVCASMWTKVI